jgi:hypothetical protein
VPSSTQQIRAAALRARIRRFINVSVLSVQ